MTPKPDNPWSRTTLGKALPIKYGKARTEKAGVVCEESPVYGSSGVIGKFDRALTNGPTLIIGRKGTVGATHYSAAPCWPIDTVYFAEASEGKDLRFFKYLLDHLQLGKMDRSTAVPSLSRDDYNAKDVAIPNFKEQQRIVAEIEKQFTRLDAGVASLKRVQSALKRYGASVLKAACEGTLVPTEAELARKENRSYETGEQLLQRILKERREKWKGKGKYKEPVSAKVVDLLQLPDGWTWATVQQLNPAERPCAYGVLQPGPDVQDGIPLVRVGDINNGKVDQAYLKLIAPKIAAKYPRTKLKGGEVAISLVGAIGRTAVIPDGLAGANTARAVGIMPMSKLVNSHWVEIWFRNPRKIAEMTSKSHEVARKTLNLEDVRVALVALPPATEQERIVTEVDRRLSVAEELEAAISTELRRAVGLRQSILQSAFTVGFSHNV